MNRVLFLSEPSDRIAQRTIREQSSLPFSYPEVGYSRKGSPPGYSVNHHRARLGEGQTVFERAAEAIHRWEMYNLNWTRLHSPSVPIRPGETVAIAARHAGFWSLNACRIVYLVDESQPIRRRGFGFGTLPGHVEQGEERFTVEHLPDESVWFELFAFARAWHPLARLAPLIVRIMQRQFAVEAGMAVQRFVGSK